MLHKGELSSNKVQSHCNIIGDLVIIRNLFVDYKMPTTEEISNGREGEV